MRQRWPSTSVKSTTPEKYEENVPHGQDGQRGRCGITSVRKGSSGNRPEQGVLDTPRGCCHMSSVPGGAEGKGTGRCFTRNPLNRSRFRGIMDRRLATDKPISIRLLFFGAGAIPAPVPRRLNRVGGNKKQEAVTQIAQAPLNCCQDQATLGVITDGTNPLYQARVFRQ